MMAHIVNQGISLSLEIASLFYKINSKKSLKKDQPLIDKLSDSILFSDKQLTNNFNNTAPEKTTYLIFVLAYLNWLYNLLESTAPKILNSLSDDGVKNIFTKYTQIFNQVKNL
jgi:hypothetical protein